MSKEKSAHNGNCRGRGQVATESAWVAAVSSSHQKATVRAPHPHRLSTGERCSRLCRMRTSPSIPARRLKRRLRSSQEVTHHCPVSIFLISGVTCCLLILLMCFGSFAVSLFIKSSFCFFPEALFKNT